MSPPPQVGVLLASFDTYGRGLGDLPADARRLEQLGFDSVWAGDHLQFNVPILECLTVLGAAAAVTERVTLGSAVLLAALRHPAWVVKQVQTLQHLSAGRLVLGIGVGGEKPEEWEAGGVPRGERGRRTDALLEAFDDLVAGRPAHLPAPYAQDLEPLTPGVARPPVWIGGRSEAALRRTIRHGDVWVGAFAAAKLFRAVRSRLDELAAEAGRQPPGMASVLFVHIGDDRAHADRAARQITERQYRVPFEAMDRYIVRGPLEQVAERLAEEVAAGLEHLVVMPVDTEPRRQYEPLAELRALLAARE